MKTLQRQLPFIFALVLASCVLIFTTSFPTWYAYTHTPSDKVFTGQASWFDPWDINVYVAAIHSGQLHGFLLENTFTSEPNRAIFYYPLYTLVGQLFPTVNAFILFHSLATVMGVVLVGVLGCFVLRILHNRKETILSILIMCFGGGLGFLFSHGQNSIDSSMTSITLHSAFQRAHEALAIASSVTALFGSFFWLQYRTLRWQVLTQVSLVLAIIFYPYNILSFALITGINWWTTRQQYHWRDAWHSWGSHVVLGLLAVLAMAINLQRNSSFSGVISQSLSHPTPMALLVGYGVLLALFVYQLVVVKPRTKIQHFLTIWVLVSLVLVFFPVGIARFFLRGLFIPLTLLVVFALRDISQRYFTLQQAYVKNWLLIYLLLVVSLTNSLIFYERVRAVTSNNPWYYLTEGESAALNCMQNQLPIDSTILSLYYMGNQIPAHTNSRVFFGHLLQTPEATVREQAAKEFYTGKLSTTAALQFLEQRRIQYVYYGREEQQVTAAQREASFTYTFLQPLFQEQGVIIYGFSH